MRVFQCVALMQHCVTIPKFYYNLLILHFNFFRRKMSHRPRVLNDKELEEILQNWENSEDGVDFSDDDDVADPTYGIQLNELDSTTEDEEEDPNTTEQDITSQNNTSLQASCSRSVKGTITNSSTSKKRQSNASTQKVNVIWKNKHLQLNDEQLRFHGSTALPIELLELDTPYQIFSFLFGDDIIDLIRDETNLYSVQKDASKPVNVTSQEIRQFIGIVYYMSIIHMPNVRSYWSDSIGFVPIKEIMTSKRFEQLRQMLHFNDNSKMLPYQHEDSDRLYKIRPLIVKLNQNFAKVPLEADLAVDEQMCSTKARSVLKRYLPNKPSKWGFKLYVISGVSGFAYKFEVSSGQENKVDIGDPQLGASSNVVVRLAKEVPTNRNYRLFFDNYYTSLPLIEYFSKRGILTLGTIRKNRIPNCKLPDEKQFKKEPRGTSVEQVGSYNGIDIAVLAWKDNKIVTLASNFAGKNPTSTVRRYDKSQKQYITVERPFVVAEYNRHMGGVDLLDCIMGHYKIKLRSKRWYIRLFYHFLDMAMSNAWLLYRRIHEGNERSEKVLHSVDFRVAVAETLCKYKTVQKKSRKSAVEIAIQQKKKKGPTQHLPPTDVRMDDCAHWPIWKEKRMRCKFPGCSGFTQTICEKCGVGLCYNKTNNCFKDFHVF